MKLPHLCVALLCFAPLALAQPAANVVEETTSQLANESTRAKAIDQIRQLLTTDPRHTPRILSAHWIKPMMAAQMYSEVDELARRAILARPRVSPMVADLQKARAEALLAAGKHSEALVAARGYFNVCMMRETKEAIVLLSKALDSSRGGDAAQKFLAEQTAGAAADALAEARASVLASIPVDAAFMAEIDARAGNTATTQDARPYDAMVELGNLLLVAGRGQEAAGVFAAALKIAPSNGMTQAVENRARAMRAADGAVGRANAWLLSRRDIEAAVPTQTDASSATQDARDQ